VMAPMASVVKVLLKARYGVECWGGLNLQYPAKTSY
jgi:hypothetical protein